MQSFVLTGGINMKTKDHLWIPTRLALIYILIISIFALGAFFEDTALSDRFIGFLLGLRLPFMLLLVLGASRKSPIKGGITFLMLSVILTYQFVMDKSLLSYLVFTVPSAVIGMLFIVLQIIEKKKAADNKKD
jgi:hypothetical protein